MGEGQRFEFICFYCKNTAGLPQRSPQSGGPGTGASQATPVSFLPPLLIPQTLTEVISESGLDGLWGP